MTTTTDPVVSFTFSAQYYDPDAPIGERNPSLPVTNIRPSMNMDRVPYCTAELDLEGIDYDTFLKLDPRVEKHGTAQLGNVVRFVVEEHDEDGNVRTGLIRHVSATNRSAYMPIRSATYDHVTGSATITLGGRESILDDRKRIATNTIDTGAADVADLIYWSLIDTFSSYSITVDSVVTGTPIPAGDSRLMQPGESHNDLIEPELQAIGCRLYDYWGERWYAVERNNTPMLGVSFGYPRTLQLATYTQREGAPPNADPIIYELTERLDRGGDYADGVLVKFDTTSTGGATTYQRSGNGDNTKGRVITWPRTSPAANAANELVTRTKIRGQDITIRARARLDITPGQTLHVYARNDVHITANVRSVEWDLAAGDMTIQAQTGIPEE